MKTVPPGEVGIKVNMVGGNRGIDTTPLVTGRVIYNSINERIYIYPTYLKSYFYSAKDNEGSPTRDESITFSAKGGIGFRANVGIAVSIEDKSVPGIFKKYRQDLDYLIANVIHNEVRDAFNRYAGAMDPIEILATRKAELLAQVKDDLNHGFLGKDGFFFSMVSFTDTPLPLDPNVQTQINAVFTQTQAANAAQQKVREMYFVAEQQMATARGDSASTVIAAAGQAEANRVIRATLSPDFLEYTKLNKWDGAMPQIMGSATPIVDLRK
jgi:regulator of protease activity HflC (stomatin/prohibitin superfamily)